MVEGFHQQAIARSVMGLPCRRARNFRVAHCGITGEVLAHIGPGAKQSLFFAAPDRDPDRPPGPGADRLQDAKASISVATPSALYRGSTISTVSFSSCHPLPNSHGSRCTSSKPIAASLSRHQLTAALYAGDASTAAR
jgi:hypothetical protein